MTEEPIKPELEDADDIAVAKQRLADEADGWVSLDELRAEAGGRRASQTGGPP